MTCSTPSAQGQVTFAATPEVVNPDSLYFTATGVGDFNGDGEQDIAVVSDNRGNHLYILLNQGNGQFSLAYTYSLAMNGGDPTGPVLVGDVNNDGKLDLVIITTDPITGDWSYNVALGSGDGSFTAPGAYPQDVPYPFSPVLADFNGDHKLDLALVPDYSSLVIYYGNGDGTFQAPVSYPAGQSPVALAVGDFNNDGNADAAVLSQNGLGILMGNGDGTFQAPVFTSSGITSGLNSGSLLAGSLAGGNIVDLVGSTETGEQVFIGKGDGTFTALPVVNNLSVQFLADFNNDGLLDAAANGGIQLGNGDGTFGSPITVAYWARGFAAGGISGVGDFNNDGLPDLSVNNEDFETGVNGVYFLLNTTTFGFSVSATQPENIAPGGSTTSTVTIISFEDFNGPVSLSCSGLPTGASCSFNPSTVPGGSGTSGLTITTTQTTAPGIYPVTVTGTSGSMVNTAMLNLTLQEPPGGDFLIAATDFSPSTITAGNSATATITISPQYGFSGTVTLLCGSNQGNPTCSFNPATIAGGSGTSTLTVETSDSTTSGTYTIDTTGESGRLLHGASSSVIVDGIPFVIGTPSGSPTSATMVPGQSATFNLNLTPEGPFSGAVDLTCAITPAESPAPVCSLPASVDLAEGTTTPFTVIIPPRRLVLPDRFRPRSFRRTQRR
jgi:hypothetical protein